MPVHVQITTPVCHQKAQKLLALKSEARHSGCLVQVTFVLLHLFLASASISAQNWVQETNLPNHINWISVASSGDGSKLFASDYFGDVYLSTNSGAAWAKSSLGLFGDDACVACSADAQMVVAALRYPGVICTSTNAGASWVTNDAPDKLWLAVACSADGSTVIAAATSWPTYTSTNYGKTWSSNNTPSAHWSSVASSAEGTELFAVAFDDGAGNGGLVYSSTNSGTSWVENRAPSVDWSSTYKPSLSSVACSAGGAKVIVAAYGGSIYHSTNAGAEWTPCNVPWGYWKAVASSADGTKLLAGMVGGGIYTSTDSGITWSLNNTPITSWWAVAMSADGSKLVALEDSYPNGGCIYSLHTVPMPGLNFSLFGDFLVIFHWAG